MSKIVVFGSINTDLVINTNKMPKNGETIYGGKFFISQGGKGANQAIAASMLGGKVDLIACIGRDSFGYESLSNLKMKNVNTSNIRLIDNVSSSVAMIIRFDNDNRIILGDGSNNYLESNDLRNYFNKNSDGGIFVTQLENKKDVIIEAIKIAKEHNMFTIFNPTPAIALEEDVYKYIDLLVINQTESEILSDIYPKNRHDCKSVYDHFRKLGIKNLIITLGKIGSLVFENENMVIIEGHKVEAVDSTGAGDCYIGALAYGLSIGWDITKSSRLASIASAISVTKVGAQSGMPTIEEVNKFIEGD